MELKLYFTRASLPVIGLLIVPYGIETFFQIDLMHCCLILLIVPYGIETIKPAVNMQ